VQYRSHEISDVDEFCRRELNQELSIRQPSQAFDYDIARIRATLANGLDHLENHAHHFTFDRDSEAQILQWIAAQAEAYKSITRTDFRHDYKAKNTISISRGSVSSFIFHH
jgi:peptidoglycan/xylan/chitin deacetylase (PgdA/CDA1 family)